jgi:hypothetical protein
VFIKFRARLPNFPFAFSAMLLMIDTYEEDHPPIVYDSGPWPGTMSLHPVEGVREVRGLVKLVLGLRPV